MSINTKQGHLLYSPFMEEFTNYSDRGRTKLNMDFIFQRVLQYSIIRGMEKQRPHLHPILI